LVVEEIHDVPEERVGVKAPILDRPGFLPVENISTLKMRV